MTETQIKLLQAVARLAGRVVLETPVRSSYSQTSYVRRSLIRELEAALVAAGYDMAKARSLMKAARKEIAERAKTGAAALVLFSLLATGSAEAHGSKTGCHSHDSHPTHCHKPKGGK